MMDEVIIDEDGINLALHRLAQDYRAMMPYYDKICALAQAQESILRNTPLDAGQLMEYVRERQEFIDILKPRNTIQAQAREEIRLALGLKEFALDRMKGRFRGDGLPALEKAVADVCAVLERINNFDKKNEEALRLHIGETRESLNRLRQTKAARKAYKEKPKQSDGVFVDLSK